MALDTDIKLYPFYRIYSGSADNRPVFDGDKFSLVKLCFDSFIRQKTDDWEAIVFLLDDCPYEYVRMVEGHGLALRGKWGNQPSFQYQLYTALECVPDDGLILFVEDDYFWLPNAVQKMMTFFKVYDDCFVTPYDHPDRYSRTDNRDVPPLEVVVAGQHHWRTVESTCMTFVCRKATLVKYQDIIMRHACEGRGMWYPILDEGTKLWGPIPSLATHMRSGFLAPCIEWQTEWDKALKEIQR